MSWSDPQTLINVLTLVSTIVHALQGIHWGAKRLSQRPPPPSPAKPCPSAGQSLEPSPFADDKTPLQRPRPPS